ncbi:hypothetical protein GLOIN_2v1504728 [Rhizophagus irregularis DAOM 181602=DAOM 197198]|uniref:ATP-dependent DNA helicase n=1 Tax=Rhizophagus irregularis (strain DAOM 181602 / DAOM 197198 / MUCL 43194) TaxID=747089 RepID=A0A2P4QVT3_RHIID|nr:hypothetical protein GLOIN_2v1504728 [Rhizophagus irregularis DAOM 181602=DAOM 197198]POG81712.1 hypothetical protein GLOIN_2v1504728 [Rhizophagus irregularis DAOM 181602=DAOM 197198]|eukprot:XP_025188578.1 hypothetical protein GLOIN_2v1504728 [Rhizophagus irregularis DAOM 181602=DAOM 197198]
MGTAGTSKSYLINIIRERLQESSIVLASTGVAAFNIQGSTIHSALSIILKLEQFIRVALKLRRLIQIQQKILILEYY